MINKNSSMTVLSVENLRTYYRTDKGLVHAVDGVSFSVAANETLGLVGESGSGKTTIAESINRILPDNAEIAGGSIRYDEVDLAKISANDLRKYRWNDIALIPQSAMNAFDPVYTVGAQIVEVIRAHNNEITKPEARERARELFELVDLDPDRISDYPHQFSGGMRQRAAIAIALALNPALILADEPTTALDVIVENQILTRIKSIQREINTSMILITHDISVVSEVCDRTAVVYAGRIAETGDTDTIIDEPCHPYTMGLRNAFPTLEAGEQELISIPGSPPELVEPEEGCRFADRCPFAVDECYETTPEPEEIKDGHYVECHRADEADELRERAGRKETWWAKAESKEIAND